MDGLTDEAHTVRVEAVRGLEQMEGESALLLRLKARLGDEGAGGDRAGVRLAAAAGRASAAVPFVAEFLKADRDTRAEAALALGSSRLPGRWTCCGRLGRRRAGAEFRQVILRALSVSRQEARSEFLLETW